MDTGRYLLLEYDYVADIAERRAPHRSAHLAHLDAAKERGLVVAAGAVGDGPDRAVIVLRDDPAAAEALAVEDPYVLNGLVTAWRIAPWTVVV